MAPLTDYDAWGDSPSGVWFNRVHSFEAGEGANGRTVHFPKSCLHCEQPACVTVCPTGASFKRAEDGIVLVNEDICIGCKLCSWACPYGAREFDEDVGVMKKCTLCIDRIYNDKLEEVDRVPACVSTCPVGARHFGDLGDPNSEVSQAGGGARRLRPDAGARLQADQQIPAAPHWPRAGRLHRRRHQAAGGAARATAPATGCCAGSTARCRGEASDTRCPPPTRWAPSPLVGEGRDGGCRRTTADECNEASLPTLVRRHPPSTPGLIDPGVTSFAKAPHPSPARGEEILSWGLGS